jgi:hypothetical protein
MSVEYIRHEFLRHESVRESTFQNWPQNKIDFHDLVSAGFYYESNGDEVICFSCNVRISGWSGSSHAFLVHRSLSPNCSFLKGTDISINRLAIGNYPNPVAVPLISSSEMNSIVSSFDFVYGFSLERPNLKEVKNPFGYGNLKEIDAYYTVPLKIPSSEKPNMSLCIESFFKMMRIEELRLKTFEIRKWPHENPKPINLAKSGFFYCLLNDNAQCAFCRCVIGGWKSDSNPFEVHRNLFPSCQYINQSYINLEEEEVMTEIEIIEIIQGVKPNAGSINQNNNENRLLCKICFDKEISIRFNCKHCIACKECSSRVFHCPICRTSIKRRQDVILC